MGDHIFICHARRDEDFVLKLAANLKERGVPVWLDQWDIPPGTDWDLTIDNAIYDCARFLIVLSPAAVASQEVRGELRTALDEDKPIVSVLYQACRIPRQLRLIQHVDFSYDSYDGAFKRLLAALGESDPASAHLPRWVAPRRLTIGNVIRSRPFQLVIALITTILVAIVIFALVARFRSQLATLDTDVSLARVIRTASEIHIDGLLNESAWLEVDPLTYAVHPERSGSTTAAVRFLWDDAYLYAGFDVNDTQVEMADLSTLWDSDSVSLLLHDGGIAEHRQSFGAKLSDDMAVQLKPGTTLNEPTDTDTGYTVEMRIKWKNPPSVGRRIPADLLSVDHDANPGAKYDAPGTVFSKFSWDGDGEITSAGASLLLVDGTRSGGE